MRRRNHPKYLSLVILLTFAVVVLLGFPISPKATGASPTGWYNQRYKEGEQWRCVSALDAKTIWIGGNTYIYRTTDGGTTWEQQWSGGPTASVQGLTAVNANTVWAVGSANNTSGIIKTDNGGANWSLKYTGNASIAISAIGANIAWAVGGQNTIVKTVDGGLNWTNQNSGLDADTVFNDICAVDEKTVWAVGSHGEIIKTADGGSTWGTQVAGPTWQLHAICAVDANNAWAVGDSGILHTTDGQKWSAQPSGTDRVLSDVVAIDANTAWTSGDDGTVLKTTDGGATWKPQYPWPAEDFHGIDAINANTAWVVGNKGVVCRTDDGGYGNLPRPYIKDLFSPDFGPVGSKIEIRGNRFGSTRGSSYVAFGSVAAIQYASWSNYAVEVIVPPLESLPVTVPVKVITPAGSSNEHTYEVTLPPTVATIAPSWGYGGAVINAQVTGTNFQKGATVGLREGGFGPDAVTATNVVVVSSTQITCTFYLPSYWSPINPSLVYHVVVTNPDGNYGTLLAGFQLRSGIAGCGVGALGPVGAFGVVLGMLSLAGSLRGRRRRRKAS